MAQFKCHKCGFVSPKTGSCSSCKIPLEKVCGICGYGFDGCICTGGSTKEPRARH